MAKKSQELEHELEVLKARIAEQKRAEQEAAEGELLRLVRRGGIEIVHECIDFVRSNLDRKRPARGKSARYALPEIHSTGPVE